MLAVVGALQLVYTLDTPNGPGHSLYDCNVIFGFQP
jgi:hypothetical protein